jgi:predicted dehydrogenase
MSIKIAFAGLRHGHIFGLLQSVTESDDFELVAIAEEDDITCEQVKRERGLTVSHRSIDIMLEKIECDVVAIGDYFGKRGNIAIQALGAGKHIISDKPICTRLDELEQIQTLVESKQLKVGCQLDLREHPNFAAMKHIVSTGVLGKINAVNVGAQHPLMWGTRAPWYFEPGKHGGVINDIGVHVIDLLEWVTGNSITQVTAARCWNAFAVHCPHFKDSGQFMAVMSNGCGIIADVSYAMPASCGYSSPYYWEVKLWGERGVVVANLCDSGIKIALEGDKKIKIYPAQTPAEPNYFTQFVNDIANEPVNLSTQHILQVSRKALKVQQAANECLFAVDLSK